jgi:5S rRNA maturation endonuclease (ribonuclease M5)
MNHTQKKKSHFDYQTINSLILSNLEIFLKYFNISLNSDNKKYFGECPIHYNSDNPQALILYKNSGVWLCTTHHCEQTFQKFPIGFVRALLSSKKRGWQDIGDTNKVSSVQDAIDFSQKLLNKSCFDLNKTPKTDILINEKRNFIRQSSLIKQQKILFTLENYKKHCEIPSEYFISRGFTKSILEKYNIGTLKKHNHQFNNKTVVPILDYSNKYIIGLSARINHPYCLICNYYHSINTQCIDKSTKTKIVKWEHSYGFDKRNCLFNYCESKECINKYGKIIIVEGPMDCVKLAEANICYSVAILGSSISQQQCTFIKKCNIDTVIIATDNDEGGEIARDSIIKYLGKNYKYINIDIPKNDIGDLTIEEIQELFNES